MMTSTWDENNYMRYFQRMFNSFLRRLNKDGIHTLVDIVIVDPMWLDLFPRSYETKGFVTFDVGQTKERRYCDWHLIDQFLPLVSEVFGFLHKQVDVFLHNCANVIWSLKRLEGFHLFV
jgi:hypothetical protein